MDVELGRQESGIGTVLDELTVGLAPLTADGDNSLVVADRFGRVLWRSGSTRVLTHADRLGFVEGVVDVSGPAAAVHPTTLALVSTVAKLAEARLREVHLAGLERLRSVAAPMLAGLGCPGLAVDVDGWVADVGDLPPRSRIALPSDLTGPTVRLPELGVCTVYPLPGGWLLQPDPGDGPDVVTRVTLDLRPGRAPEVAVAGGGGSRRYQPSPRHAQILALLADGAGRSAAQLADALFGDSGRVVTVRAEISRLRRALSGVIAAQPYRFADGVSVELLR